ncbi:hypothetical protein [Methylobacter sp.]|uniref:lipopolysaccharide biosynthesis protein n=1 Tax=Methylobacter sp. TaxID=2051955 RepID=UPI0012035E0D|nr:hypothetical protein [Methylobacter sp.]TAK61988.1 MAG: hypothetical protein EPO18_12040 [Methylobacter sp.]
MNVSPYSGVALKRSAIHLLVGKVASALLTFSILFLLVRLLTTEEYGTYVTLEAGSIFVLSITSFGLPWLAARYLPEFRLHGNGDQLAYFIWRIIALISLFNIMGASLLFMAMPWLLEPLGLMHQIDVARLYLLVLVLEGLRGNILECTLEPLLLQRQAQLSQIMRNLAFLSGLSILAIQGMAHLYNAVLAELAGTFLGTTSALLSLTRHLHTHRNLQGMNGWQVPNWSEMWRATRHMYFSNLVTLTYGSSVLVFLTQRFLGVETTALFGFLYNLFGQIRRYLPSSLLLGLIRPKLIASYMGEDGAAQLTRNANLVGKVSLFVLMPLLVFVWLAGSELLNLISGGKFTQAGYYFGGLLMALIPLSQRQILETVAIASGRSDLCSWGSFLGILTLPLAYWLLESGQGIWSPIIAMVAGQLIFNVILVTAMRFTTPYRPDTIGFLKLSMAALMGYGLGILVKMAWEGSLLSLPNNDFAALIDNAQGIVSKFLSENIDSPVPDLLSLTTMGTLACSLFLLVAYFFKPFRVEERMRLNRFLNRNIFIW